MLNSQKRCPAQVIAGMGFDVAAKAVTTREQRCGAIPQLNIVSVDSVAESHYSLGVRGFMTDRPITQILAELRSDGRSTVDELLPIVYSELRRLAGAHLSRERSGHTLQPTALVHEAYIRLIGQSEIEWQDRAHFFGFASRLMRQILIEHARGRNRLKRGGKEKTQIAIDDAVSFGDSEPLDVLAVDEALSKLEELDAKQARIVEMKFFGGLTVDEIAEVESISPATVKREWSTAKLFLHRMLR
ncbi:MAG: sigma-70 family RNA polymerase sigma factor, partial [Pyrinomonadaceae bacterium]|nr:sigma-70 family RNA polymerase sigma factor [Pyrinomonadaceae bacterium]